MTLADLRDALEREESATAEQVWSRLTAAERAHAAPLALGLGRPALAATWAREEGDPLTLAAACLRLGQPGDARAALRHLPGTARVAVLLARAAWQRRGADAADLATHARTRAREEGDAGALIAAATLLGEMGLTADPQNALRTLAEGLKVAEMGGTEADPHLLAVLAHAQATLGGREKARRTAEKAMARALPRSPARVAALLALGRGEEARAEARAGDLGEVWLRPFLTPGRG